MEPVVFSNCDGFPCSDPAPPGGAASCSQLVLHPSNSSLHHTSFANVYGTNLIRSHDCGSSVDHGWQKTLRNTGRKHRACPRQFCCIRLSHALITARHPITRSSDYLDKDGNKYIIRVATMIPYLEAKSGPPDADLVKAADKDYLGESKGHIADVMSKPGIIALEIPFTDASGHVTLQQAGVIVHGDPSYVARPTRVRV